MEARTRVSSSLLESVDARTAAYAGKKIEMVHEKIRVGDVVLVIEPNQPRGNWSMGRIEETIKGSDGNVRSAKVRVRGSIYMRPIVKLCPLELSS